MYTKFVYKDDTVILFLRCWKAHDTHLLKMYVRWLSVVSELNLSLSTLVKFIGEGRVEEQAIAYKCTFLFQCRVEVAIKEEVKLVFY